MQLQQKEYFKISFLYTATAAFPPLLNLLVRPLIEGTDRLNAVDFSQMEIAEVITSLAFIIAIFAMGNAISRFYYDHNQNQKTYNELISGVFISILFRGLLILALAFIFQNQIGKIFTQDELQNFSQYGFAAIIIGINRSVNMTAFALYRNEKKVRLYLIFSFALGILRSGFQLIGIFYYDMSFIGYVYGSCIGSSIVSMGILIYTFNKTGFHYNRKLLKPVNQFALPLFEYSLIAWGISFADRYFLESSPIMLGIYGQALILGKGIEIILQGLQGASQPEIYRLMKDGIKKNTDQIKKLSHILMAQSQLFIAITIIPAMIYCLFFKTDIKMAIGLIAIVFIRYILRTQYIIFSFPVYFMKKTKIFLYLNLFVLLLNIGLLYYLIPIFGIYGAIIAFLVSQSIQVIGIYLYQRSLVHIPWNLNKLLITPIIIIFLTSILEVLKVQFNINHFVTSSIVVFMILSSLIILYRNELRSILLKLWKQFS